MYSDPGAFFFVAGSDFFYGGTTLDKRELAYVRQTIPAVKEWDEFQMVIRVWAKLIRFRAGGSPRPVAKTDC